MSNPKAESDVSPPSSARYLLELRRREGEVGESEWESESERWWRCNDFQNVQGLSRRMLASRSVSQPGPLRPFGQPPPGTRDVYIEPVSRTTKADDCLAQWCDVISAS